MDNWEIIKEEASIVLVGGLNPKIFHPEWFIRKEIIEEWDYNDDNVVCSHDFAEIEFPNDRKLTVLLNKFSILTPLATEFQSIKDVVANTFSLLSETLVYQMGMNFNSVIKITDEVRWKKFGHNLAPEACWKQAVTYFDKLDENKQREFGLLNLTMNIPRPDDLKGYIRPQITALKASPYILKFDINNHFELEDKSTNMVIEILEKHWEKSLDLSKELTKSIMNSQLI